ncbi:MAG: hypothetical protein GX285_08045 [Clostridiales bacterium]|nr:hypothetical protein [Clostridiales bacterium]
MKKYFVWIMLFAILVLSLLNINKTVNYNNYDEINLLSQMSESELKNKKYSNDDINKIKAFGVNYNNYLKLLDIVKNDNLKNHGYNNRNLNSELMSNFVYNKNDNDIQDDNLSFTTTVIDFFRDKNTDRDVGRIIIEFEWDTEAYNQNQYIDIKHPNYALVNVYGLLKYKNIKDKSIEYKMFEDYPIETFRIDYRKIINKQKYILKSGIIVLDVMSFYKESIAPLSISSKYIIKPFLRKEKILSEYIINVEKNEN